ncbi:GNAT family N-acetyltransferase [Azospirillum picis]|uniref:GNAT superfamily N-acetyltransferase n=1 Tax=Azospirillum picis TaxID=488438 RepID=A0ABU0MH18_9PROT|nr:GNAT family N-acetyltransferase [Azospirillum picis]MBP2298420.1 GNAT superfamily N-acetyltransferase [Azospirillum picis]MDQ0532531.1 GNAT superfamily N-acetyltransferase [Azospirillum picis]
MTADDRVTEDWTDCTQRQGIWRPMRESDLDAVLAVADVVHRDYPEDRSIFVERLALYSPGCRVAQVDGLMDGLADGGIIGYGIMHPGRLGAPPPLDTPLGRLPADADCLYIHDIALLPAARGSGLGAAVLDYAHALATREGWDRLALTSTPGARSYWDRAGFLVHESGGQALAAKLASYGEGMAYMTAPVRRQAANADSSGSVTTAWKAGLANR